MGKEIVADPQGLLRLQKPSVIVQKELTRRQAAFVRLDSDRRPMGIRAGHHEDAVAFEPMVTGKDVRWQQCPGQVPNV
jgi:hypothetical protein